MVFIIALNGVATLGTLGTGKAKTLAMQVFSLVDTRLVELPFLLPVSREEMKPLKCSIGY